MLAVGGLEDRPAAGQDNLGWQAWLIEHLRPAPTKVTVPLKSKTIGIVPPHAP